MIRSLGFFDSHNAILLDLVLQLDFFDHSDVRLLTLQHIVCLLTDPLFQVGSIWLCLLHYVLEDALQVRVGQVVNRVLSQQVALNDGRVGHHVQQTLHLILLLRLHIIFWLMIGLFEGLCPKVYPLELQVHLEGE